MNRISFEIATIDPDGDLEVPRKKNKVDTDRIAVVHYTTSEIDDVGLQVMCTVNKGIQIKDVEREPIVG